MSQVFAFIKACAKTLSKRAGSTTSRVMISAAVVVATTALAGAIGMAQAGAVSTGTPAAIASGPASIAESAQETGSSAPCFKASYPDCSSTDPDVSWGAVSSGDTSGCEFQEDVAWGDGTTNDYTFPGGPDGTQLATFTHKYSKPGTYTITATGQTLQGSCSTFDATLQFTLLTAATPPPGGTPACDSVGGSGGVPDYCIPADWDAHTVPGSATQGMEPLNVIISARSTVPFATVLKDLSDWDQVPTGTLETTPKGCMSEETADVTGTAQVGQQQSWRLTTKLFGHRLSGCDGGAKLLALAGVENHVRIWNQPITGSTVGGAWFVTASLEKACAIRHYPYAWHCIVSNGYNEGADQFVSDIIVAAHQQGWTVTTRLDYRASGTGGLGANPGPGTGLDGTAYSGNVEVVTVTAG